MIYVFDADLWLWQARTDSWTFLSLPREASDEIREIVSDFGARGFGSVRVTATIGATTWQTSIFPSAKGEPYVLPVKRAVQKAEGVTAGDTVTAKVELRSP